MTKRLVPYYTFEPSTNTVKVPGNIKAEKNLLITNITGNKPIYIFSDGFWVWSQQPIIQRQKKLSLF